MIKIGSFRIGPMLFLGALALLPAAAQTPGPHPVPEVSFAYLAPPEHPVRARASGDSLTLDVRVELPDGWHINSDAPLDSFLVPTSLEIKGEGLAFGKPRYPSPLVRFSKAMGAETSLFTGTFDVQIPAKRSKKGAASPSKTRVTLHYQACNESMCLPPRSITVEQ